MQHNNSTSLRMTSRFDALKSDKRETNNSKPAWSKPKPSVQSSATLFSVGNNSLSDYITSTVEDTPEKYVSPSMRWREQKSRTRQNFRRNNFAQDKNLKTYTRYFGSIISQHWRQNE